VKYFFLTEGWRIGRVWEDTGLWDTSAWRRQPDLEKLPLCILEQGEKLWLYQVEDAVLMIEVNPPNVGDQGVSIRTIGQVVLKRLITAEQAIERLCVVEQIVNSEAELSIKPVSDNL
jgi:hypothetical protein